MVKKKTGKVSFSHKLFSSLNACFTQQNDKYGNPHIINIHRFVLEAKPLAHDKMFRSEASRVRAATKQITQNVWGSGRAHLSRQLTCCTCSTPSHPCPYMDTPSPHRGRPSHLHPYTSVTHGPAQSPTCTQGHICHIGTGLATYTHTRTHLCHTGAGFQANPQSDIQHQCASACFRVSHLIGLHN